MTRINRQSGAVSLFVVIFAALLMTIVTISFIQLMVRDQRQATVNDLSQSAYDSAQAGVEDAKRLLLLDQSCRNGTAALSINCTTIANALVPAPGQTETTCDTLAKAGIVNQTNNETIIEQSTGDNAAKLDQAYTCVKIKVENDDYKRELEVNKSETIPIRGVGTFDSIELSWFHQDDVDSGEEEGDPMIGFPSSGADVSLPPVGTKWQANHPALMRVQFMQTGDSFKLTDFDNSQTGNKSDANTLFLYPSETGLPDKDFALDARRSPLNAPQLAHCVDSFVESEYACKVTLRLPNPIDGSSNRGAFLRLSALYNGAHVKVALKNGGDSVKFDRVQPEVDSTGRANDMFRRVKARVELVGNFTHPEAAVDLTGNLCKNFTVTDQDSGFSKSTTCNP
jgi:Tfp pilus assembly protein PilX